jgi:hypothetical protein
VPSRAEATGISECAFIPDASIELHNLARNKFSTTNIRFLAKKKENKYPMLHDSSLPSQHVAGQVERKPSSQKKSGEEAEQQDAWNQAITVE